MLQPIGAKGSPNHHDIVLSNWARQRGIDIGQKGRAGYAIYVGKTDRWLLAFFVEGRGPTAHPVMCAYTWLEGSGWRGSQFGRGKAFKRAVDLFFRLTGRS